MASINKVIILGNVGRTPELRYTNTGTAVCSFSVATTMKNRDGEQTEWHAVTTWDKTAEICGQYLEKGRQVYVEGRIQTRQWTDKEGAMRQKTEIVASQVVLLGSKGQGGQLPDYAPPPSGGDDGDVPF